MTFNSTYTLINSQRKCDAGTFAKAHDFASDEELRQQFPPNRIPAHAGGELHDNIVIIIVESLSADYTGVGHPLTATRPSWTLSLRRGFIFKIALPTGAALSTRRRRSWRAFPTCATRTFSALSSNTCMASARMLKERGYNTSFFHGGKNGTMSFDTFSLRMGFDHYYGLNEYPTQKDSDGIWGIYDEPYLHTWPMRCPEAGTVRIRGVHPEHAQSLSNSAAI